MGVPLTSTTSLKARLTSNSSPALYTGLAALPGMVTLFRLGAWVSTTWVFRLLRSWLAKALPERSLTPLATKLRAKGNCWVLALGVTLTEYCRPLALACTELTVPLLALKWVVVSGVSSTSLRVTTKRTLSLVMLATVVSLTAVTTGAMVSTVKPGQLPNMVPVLPARSLKVSMPHTTGPVLVLAAGL